MSQGADAAADERVRLAAAEWFARMRGPDAAQWGAGLAAWRAETPDHDEAYERLQRRWDQSAFLTHSAMGRARTLQRASVWSRRPGIRFAAIAAGVIMVAGLGALVSDRAEFTPHSATPVDYANEHGPVREIRLADGSRVTLDASAAIRAAFTRSARRIQMVRGRARFAVAAGSPTPFIVEAASTSIAAHDGLFDVSLTGSTIKVVAWRGGLDFSTASDGASRLHSGQQVVFAGARGRPAPTPAESGELGWTRGMLSFERTRLADAVTAINRYNRVRIRLADPQIGALCVTGAFRASDPEGFARAIASLFHLSLASAPDGTILLAPEKKT